MTPDVTARSGALKKAVREHRRDFVAILALVVVGVLSAAIILANQRLTLPAWVPVAGERFYDLRAELATAQSITPGQGQTVNVSGIQVGEVTSVELEDGNAVVGMQIEEQYAPLIHSDASILVRPKTGLNDMTLELDPGTASEPLPEGSTISVANTQPNVNPDEILASLDADTRDYLALLLAGGGEGLGGRGEQLAAGLKRFEPTARDLKKISGALVERREHLRDVIHNFGVLTEELGARDTRLADFVESQNAVFETFASQEASIRETLRELPGTLSTTESALRSADGLARELGPAAESLRPGARALSPALRETRPFLEQSVAPIRDQIRPFTRKTRTPLHELRRLSGGLAKTSPNLRRAVGDLNVGLNELAYNPPGSEEGFLFWASWANHNTNGTFLGQDGHGPIRHGIVLASCQTLGLAKTLGEIRPFLKTLTELTRVPKPEEICPPSPF